MAFCPNCISFAIIIIVIVCNNRQNNFLTGFTRMLCINLIHKRYGNQQPYQYKCSHIFYLLVLPQS